MKKINGFPNYRVDGEGNVFSYYKKGKKKLSPSTHSKGYLVVSLYHAKKRVMKYVHGIVLGAYEGIRPAGLQVNHKNGIKTDNRKENLEYVTGSENIRHAITVLGVHFGPQKKNIGQTL